MKNRNNLTFTIQGRLPLAAALASCALLTAGCANMQTTASNANTLGSVAGKIQGSVHGGNQPVSGATVTLYSVSQTGHGTNGITLATTTTDTGGGFQFSQTATPTGGPVAPTALGGNTYECGTGADPLLYVIAKGGNTTGGGSATNSAAAFIAPVSYCSVAASQNVNVTEVTTAAMVAATGQFMNPATDELGADGIGVAYSAIGNAFSTVATLVSQSTGLAQNSVTKTGGATANAGGPFNVDTVTVTATPNAAKLNTIANILASCINQPTATSTTNCSTLFANAVPPLASHTSQPNTTFNTATDTIQAALYMFENPTDSGTTARTALFNLAAGTPPFQPTLTAVPTDWTLGVTYTSTNNCGAGQTGSLFFSGPNGLSVDAAGDIWVSNSQASSSALSAITASGAPFACVTAGTTATGAIRSSTTIDDQGNIWYGDTNSNLIRFKPSTNGTLAFNAGRPVRALAADGADGLFFTGVVNGSGSVFRIAAAATSTLPGGPLEVASGLGVTPDSIFPDGANDMWVASGAAYVTQVYSATTGNNVENNYGHQNFTLTAPVNGVVVGPANSVFATSGDNADTLSVMVAGTTYTIKSGFPTAGNLAGEVTPLGIYLDGAQNSWITDGATEGSSGAYALSVIGTDAAAISATGVGFQKTATYLNTPHSIVVDASGNVWVTNDGNTSGITELVGAAAPIYQPVAVGVQQGSARFQQVP